MPSRHRAAGRHHPPRALDQRAGHVYVLIDRQALKGAWWRAILGEPINPVLRDQVEWDAIVLLAGGLTEAVAEQRDLIGPRLPVDPAAPEHRPRYLAAIASGEPKPAGDSADLDELLRSI